MRNRYRGYYFVVLLIHIVSCYFVLCFCSTYTNSNSAWLKGFLLGNVIDYCGIKMIVPLLKTILRKLIMHCKCGCLVCIYTNWVWIMGILRPKRLIK
jgi:hypothetical protein